MVERCSNGVAFLVLEPEPSVRTGIRVDIFEGDNPSTIIARLPLTWGRKWTDPLKGTGSGEFWVHALDETLAANPGILDYGNIARFSLDEVYRFAIQIEKLDRVQVKAGGDVERTIKVSGRGVLSKLEEVVAYPAGGLAGDPVREFADATPGEILGTLFDEAQARGALTGLTRSFTDSLDSNNAPHEATLTLSERAGTSVLRIADRLAELASDVYMTPNGDLKLVNSRGIDRSQQLANAGPIILQPADNLTELTRSESGSIRNVLLIETPAGFLERSRGASVTAHGHREAFLSLGNISDGDAVDRASEAVFAKSADPAAEIGAAVLDKEGARPYVDWKPGDWVLAPNDDDELERLRVRALTVSETAEGQPIFTPDLATITEELEQRLERWLAAMSKGTVGGTAGEVAEPVQAPVEVVEAIDAGLGDHLAAQPHFDELSDLADTDITGLTDDDILRYDSADGAWEPEALELDALDDVDLTTAPTDGQVLKYDDATGLWKPATDLTGGGGGGGGGLKNHALGRGYTASPDHVDGAAAALLPGAADWQTPRHLTDGYYPDAAVGSFDRNGCISWENTSPVVTFDFGDDVTVSEVIMAGVATGSGIVTPDGYTIESSPDNSTWTTRDSRTGLTGGSSGARYRWLIVSEVSDITARYWRITFEPGGAWTAVGEIEIRGPA